MKHPSYILMRSTVLFHNTDSSASSQALVVLKMS